MTELVMTIAAALPAHHPAPDAPGWRGEGPGAEFQVCVPTPPTWCCESSAMDRHLLPPDQLRTWAGGPQTGDLGRGGQGQEPAAPLGVGDWPLRRDWPTGFACILHKEAVWFWISLCPRPSSFCVKGLYQQLQSVMMF